MSKTKEALLKEQDNLMEYYVRFYEWLDKYQPQGLSESEIIDMESSLSKPLPLSKEIITESTLNKPKILN